MNLKMFGNRKVYLGIFVLIVFIFYSYLAYRTPLTGDDWYWGNPDGMNHLKNKFENYNGRYMGNLFVIFLTRTYWIKVFIMALFATLLIILTANSSKEKSVFKYVLSLLLFYAYR